MQSTLDRNSITGRLSFSSRPSILQRRRETELDEGSSDSIVEPVKYYLSTNIMSQRALSVADVCVLSQPLQAIEAQNESWVMERAPRIHKQKIIDPREQCSRVHHINARVSTLPQPEIDSLAMTAAGIVQHYLSRMPLHSSVTRGSQQLGDDAMLQTFKIQSITKFPPLAQPGQISPSPQLPKRIIKAREKKQGDLLKWNSTVAKCKSLLADGRLSKTLIGKRLGLSAYKVHKALGQPKSRSSRLGIAKRVSIDKAPMHQRAQEIIRVFMEETDSLVSTTDIRKALFERGCRNISKPSIIKFLKEELGMVYKRCSQIPPAQNLTDCLLQRQFASKIYINSLAEGKEVVNIDESVISSTDCRKRGWLNSGERRKLSYSQRLNGINIIAASSSKGRVFFTINKGRTNQITFIHFISKLDTHLQKADPNWKKTTLLMLDNASYHRGRKTTEALQALGADVLYLGPYQYEMAPIEKLFAFIKSRDLNRLKYRVQSKQDFASSHMFNSESIQLYIKELSLQLSQLDYSWIASSFIDGLTGALKGLSMTPN